MKKTKYTEEQIAFALKQVELGTPVAEVCRKMGISDATFYNYTISSCKSDASRDVIFSWFLPQPTNPARSLECTGGVNLPANATIQCDYVPTSSSV